jgi:hypothetical protein
MNKLAPPVVTVSIKEWVTVVTTEHTLGLRSRISTFLFCAYGFLIVTTVVMYFLQGFRVFYLDVGLLKWLGAATIGEVAGLITLTIKATFKK